MTWKIDIVQNLKPGDELATGFGDTIKIVSIKIAPGFVEFQGQNILIQDARYVQWDRVGWRVYHPASQVVKKI